MNENNDEKEMDQRNFLKKHTNSPRQVAELILIIFNIELAIEESRDPSFSSSCRISNYLPNSK